LVTVRSFSPPWSVEEQDACYVVCDHDGQQLAYVYFEDEPARRSAARSIPEKEGRPLRRPQSFFTSGNSRNGDGSRDDGSRNSDDDSRDDGSHSSYRDWDSTALVDILQWVDHFEPRQT
jgi:hypothetical protein